MSLPKYATNGSAGIDICAAINEEITLLQFERKLIPTGFAISIPYGYEAQVRPRSGLAIKNGVTVLNSPGTIDSDYRGEISVILINTGNEPFTIKRGDRIAQIVISKYEQVSWDEVDELDETSRGIGGFGSTGI
ncbi:MAG: dUTP diphosphatase [Candidatus Kapaibacterium sp.]